MTPDRAAVASSEASWENWSSSAMIFSRPLPATTVAPAVESSNEVGITTLISTHRYEEIPLASSDGDTWSSPSDVSPSTL